MPPKEQFHSQWGQDLEFYNNFFSHVCGGVFVELGAADGIRLSNSLFFEDNMNWRGICIEANPNDFGNLVKNRPNCANYNIAIGPKEKQTTYLIFGQLSGIKEFMSPTHLERIQTESVQEGMTPIEININVIPLTKLLRENGVSRVNFFSLDVEGAEWGVLQTINLNEITFDFMVIEKNPNDEVIQKHLNRHGYKVIGPENGFYDTYYCKTDCSSISN